MRLVRLAMCVAAFAVVGKIAFSEDIDVQSLQAKLAAQEARLNDLQAKMNSGAYAAGGEVEGLLSANKNAVVTIGGTVNTRYFYRSGKESGGEVYIKSPDAVADGAAMYFDTDTALTALIGSRYVGTGSPDIMNDFTDLIADGGTPPYYPGIADPFGAPSGSVAGAEFQNEQWGRFVDYITVPEGNFSSFAAGSTNYAGNVIGLLRSNSIGINGTSLSADYKTGEGIGYYLIGNDPTNPNNWSLRQANLRDRRKASQGNLTIADAKLTVHIDVNEYFDAFLKIDLQSSNDGSGSDNAEQYWVRWKNVCNSGFGLKVGRDVLTFGEGGYGVLGSYAAGAGDGLANIDWGDAYSTELAKPLHNNWDEGRYVQVTPYWESRDGKFSAELSLYQTYAENARNGGFYWDGNNRKSRNFGFGSASFRLRARPIEGLLLSASIANFHDKAEQGYAGGVGAKNNTFVDLAFSYRPCFFNRMNIWGQWIHGWNVYNVDDLDSDAINLGVSFDLNESWTMFVQGDYMKSKGYGSAFNTVNTYGHFGTLDFRNSSLGYGSGYDKATAWAAYAGLQYKLPYGVMVEAGWKYEEIKWKNNVLNQAVDVKVKDAKLKGHTIYAHLGFDF